MFFDIYNGKTVLVTGHTGFKGSWLCTWLDKLGAEVHGVSNGVPTQPSMYEGVKNNEVTRDHWCDVRDEAQLSNIINRVRPDFIFHLAAQAIVSDSYTNPINTITTNICGTANILEALRFYDRKCSVVMVTSDKCYENIEQIWGYKETDPMGGKDIYSASKGAAELIFHSYYKSFFMDHPNIKLASARAGNVIGGGDWAKDRLIVDCVKKWSSGSRVLIRSPHATRPWQHVLEPLSGYLLLGANLAKDANISGQSFNFGPRTDQAHSVLQVISDMANYWGFSDPGDAYSIGDVVPFHEAGLLKLDCTKAAHLLNWRQTLSYDNCIKNVVSWYQNYFSGDVSDHDLTLQQISAYSQEAKIQNCIWS